MSLQLRLLPMPTLKCSRNVLVFDPGGGTLTLPSCAWLIMPMIFWQLMGIRLGGIDFDKRLVGTIMGVGKTRGQYD